MKGAVTFGLCAGLALACGCTSDSDPSTVQPRLAPSQPNGLSELAGTMVAMDDQLARILKDMEKGFPKTVLDTQLDGPSLPTDHGQRPL